MERKNQGKNKVVFFTNRKMGKRKHTLEDEWERPPLTLFWKTIKDQVKSLGESSDKEADISKVVVKKEWKTAWDTWKDCMSDLDAKEQLLFLQNFELVSDQEDLNGIIFSIADELQKKFKTTHEKAVNLHQKLCYQLMWWATSNGNKKEIDKEDVMEALSLCGDSIKGEHFFPICEPFFQSRIKFVTDLENRILKGKSRVTFLTGDPGCGKTNIVSFLACKPESIVTLRFHAFKPIVPGDLYVSGDLGISTPIDFWGNLLIMLRKLFKGRLYEYSVPISIELIDSVDTIRNEVLRLASVWADITGRPTVIAVDGIDHAARSGNTNTFLRTLPAPETIPENIRFILAGQPTHQFSEYPDFLSDPDRIEEVHVPNIDRGDLELLYERSSSLMKYTEYEKVLVINYITKIAKGSTLSGVFAMQEATKYSNFIDFEKNSNVKRLNSGIQSYYEYIWKTATQQVGEIRYTIDMYLAATFSVTNRRISAQTMADIYGNEIPVWQWEDILQNLFPIVTYDTLGYSVFHNDVRLFLSSHYKKAKQLLPTISGKIANYLINKDFDEKVKHEVIFKLLKESGQEEKYIDVFTCEYVMKAYFLKRDLGEIRQQMLDTLAILPRIEDKRKIVKFSCAVTSMQQHGESLRWLEREYQSDVELPFALNSEKKFIAETLFSIEDLYEIFNDIEILILKNEFIRAKQIFVRCMDKKIPGKVFKDMAQNNEENTINELLEIWGTYARKFRIAPVEECYEDKSEKNAAAYFYRGWLKEAVNYLGKNQLKYTLENISYYFKPDIEDFLQQVIKRGKTEEMEFILDEQIRNFLSERNRVSVCAWAVRNCRIDLCEEWLSEIDDKQFEYISKKWYQQKYTEIGKKKERFKIITDIMYILTYVSKDPFIALKNKALEKSEFKNDRSDSIVAANLLVSVNQIAYMEQCILFECVQKIKVEDFEALLDIILDDRYYNGCFNIDTTSYRKKVLESIIRIIDNLPHVFQESLERSLCIKAETYSEIALLEVYWRYLVAKGKGAYMELANGDFDTMDDEQGSVLEEMGMMPQDSFAETEDGMMDMSGMQDATDFDSGTTSQNDADAFVDGMDNSDINGAFTGEGSAVNDLGDYPVEEEEAGMEESSEPDMELEGNAIGSAGGDDIGIGSGMDTSGGETALSGGNPSSGEQASVQSGGIISEISGSAGMKLSDSSETSGGVYASNEGESSYTVGGQGYTSEGRSPHTDFSSAREEGKYESEGYHDFDGPMYQNTSTNMGSNQGIHAEELKKREQGIGSESGEIREVPKTREEFRKKNQRNHSHSEDHFLR